MKTLNTRDKVTIIYPGGFKPITGAHIQMVNKYLQHPDVKKVVLFISPGKRDEVSVEDAYTIVKNVLSSDKVEVVLDKKSYSPILAVYRWIENPKREPGRYALASSSKEDDYHRVKEFTRNYKRDRYGKNLPDGVRVVELPINTEPLTYQNGTPISASRAREDLRNGNYERFKENYPGIQETIINNIWNTLKTKTWEEQQVT